MTTFIGLDLAWTAHHETGVCVLEDSADGPRLLALHAEIGTPEDFAALCVQAGEDVVVAIDAPLLVEPGRRAERDLAVVFGRARAGAYTATMAFLTKMNGLAGPNLAQLLASEGFQLAPSVLDAGSRGRFALEVFPHPAHVELFSLAERLAYKKGRVAARRIAFGAYQTHLRMLLQAQLPGVARDQRVQALLSPEAITARGAALKRVEDQLDALTCAYTAYHCWRNGRAGFRVFGDDLNGAIVVPARIWPAATSSPEPSSP